MSLSSAPYHPAVEDSHCLYTDSILAVDYFDIRAKKMSPRIKNSIMKEKIMFSPVLGKEDRKIGLKRV